MSTPAPFNIVAEIDTIAEQKGFLAACVVCPLQLTCAGGRKPHGYWCSHCQHTYLTSLDKRIDCDVLRMESKALPTGSCPCCNGRDVEVLQGVSLGDRVSKR